jgi:hypothetical protein
MDRRIGFCAVATGRVGKSDLDERNPYAALPVHIDLPPVVGRAFRW